MPSGGSLLWEGRFSLAGSNRGEHGGPGFVCKSVWFCVISCLEHFFFFASGSGGVQAPGVAGLCVKVLEDPATNTERRRRDMSRIQVWNLPRLMNQSSRVSNVRVLPAWEPPSFLSGKVWSLTRVKKKEKKGSRCGFKDPPTTCSASTSH